jgi:hypothetical protein
VLPLVPAIVTTSPTTKPWAAEVVISAVVLVLSELLIFFVFVEGANPKTVAVPVSAADVIVPLVEVVYLNVTEVGTAVIVYVP